MQYAERKEHFGDAPRPGVPRRTWSQVVYKWHATAWGSDKQGAHGVNLELRHALLRSAKVVCCMCFETVYEKEKLGQRVFGILPHCNHQYCLSCISGWRKAVIPRGPTVKKCPQCQIWSPYHIASPIWLEEKIMKDRLELAYRAFMKSIPCSRFSRGFCLYRNRCFYGHDQPKEQQRARGLQSFASSQMPHGAPDSGVVETFDLSQVMADMVNN